MCNCTSGNPELYGSRDSGSGPSDHTGRSRAKLMRITILFGGTNKERLVSVASAQALHRGLPEADLWFWDGDDTVHEVRPPTLLAHSRPFEEPFHPDSPGIGTIEAALDRAKAEDRVLVLGLHGG